MNEPYRVAEKFKAVQGEGRWAGTPMAFVRFVGCSVGKRICNHCDTDFNETYSWRGGGEFTIGGLLAWAETGGYRHLCLTGGEPFDQDLVPFLSQATAQTMVHIESSGTVLPDYAADITSYDDIWLTISPKPGWNEMMIAYADEVKVIVEGLGSTGGWPTLDDAIRWARDGKEVYIQPRNTREDINMKALRRAEELCLQYPTLKLSVQLHKFLGAR